MSVPRFLIAAVLVVFASGPRRAAAQAPEQRPSRLYTIEQFLDTTEVCGPSFSADGSRVLFTSDRTGIFNVYTVPSAGGEPAPVTRSTTESTYRSSASSPRTTASSSPTTRAATRTTTSTSSPTGRNAT